MTGQPQTASEFLNELLPPQLSERVRPIRDGLFDPAEAAAGHECVVYWMHHAARGHENPALDVALHAAARLGLPLIVYQGLGGRHRFNSDRHHTFIMEGARDAARELADRGVRHVFHLAERPEEPSPLRDLCARAALVVTEDFPAPPFPAWTERLAARCGRPTVAVDAACVVPMRLVPGEHDRAFRFRDKSKKLFKQRVGRVYEEADVEIVPADGVDVGFEPVDWASADIPELCARCAIDHGIGPVAHTRGGSAAGYERWETFKRVGLRGYHKRRNRAEIERDELAISRMSAYLHHGQVSPLRLMRETHELKEGPCREGAEKYIDELWVWRELAHHLAFTRTDELESPSIIPDWARRTIAEHADDPREVLDWETLARGRTGDELWDLAQRSLLAHGELHNNVRMTWGKALLGWHRGAEPTLRTLIDLNHRYALDGNNPNSYGGLLWCLGTLDRPFNQDEPVYGTVRTRPTGEHAARMDLDRYRRGMSEPSWRDGDARVAVIGGGIAGLAAARTLADHNAAVTVIDAGREPGGRVLSGDDGGVVADLRVDLGAQYFTARDERFRRVANAWGDRGVVAAWEGRIASVERAGEVIAKDSGDERFVGVPGMWAVAAHLSDGLGGAGDGGLFGSGVEVVSGRRVTAMEREDGRWRLTLDDGRAAGGFDAVIVALPAGEAAAVLDEASSLVDTARSVEMRPCWAVAAAFEERVEVDADGLFVNTAGGPLAWAARDSSKPGRAGVDGAAETWVLHATPAWSAAHRGDDPASVAAGLLAAFWEATGCGAREPVRTGSAFWQAASGGREPVEEAPFDPDQRVALAGDWLRGGRVEGAYLSGVAAAGRVLGVLAGGSS